ncbi:Flp pilus assembly protein CpaB [Saccharothrix coeruleofusca]|uniref:SAF domain-containing protein n=1 Tax=Saccharothrix coeruleofusca TaxID=33919 RepID=UPI001FCFB6C4|nr:SAF domain-containing protein [Saccharothrix coeruleofusca]MBP2340724.1 Flp pilus assembly protein CpaB [Saccharothrix coeruleofusca]
MILFRKILAGVLALVGAALVVWPEPAPVEVVVAARDLAPGVVLSAADLRVVGVPPDLRPSGAVPLAAARDRVLVSAARAGEPLTDARLAAPDPDAASVPIRLADPEVAALLRPGSRVDVVGADSRVLAEDATVVSVRERESVVVSTARAAATAVAAESLEHPLAVTLR